MVTRWSWAVGLCILIGCVSEGRQREIVTGRAAFDMDCPRGKLQLTQLSGTTYGVRGCGKRATYLLNGECGAGQPCEAFLNSTVESTK